MKGRSFFPERLRGHHRQKTECCYTGIENSFKMAVQEDIWHDTD